MCDIIFNVIVSAYVCSCADACCVATEYKLCFDKVDLRYVNMYFFLTVVACICGRNWICSSLKFTRIYSSVTTYIPKTIRHCRMVDVVNDKLGGYNESTTLLRCKRHSSTGRLGRSAYASRYVHRYNGRKGLASPFVGNCRQCRRRVGLFTLLRLHQ